MNFRKGLLLACVLTVYVDSMNVTDVVMERAVDLAHTGAQNLTMLAQSNNSALVNYGIYSLINKLPDPSLIILGTEAAVLISLSCTQENPVACLSSLVTSETLQTALMMTAKNATLGASYALGEIVSEKSQALTKGTSYEVAQQILTMLAGAGLGFYAWSMTESPEQAMLLSMSSAAVLQSLTATRQHPPLVALHEKIKKAMGKYAVGLGKVIGVATLAGGTVALAYNKSSAQAVFGAVMNAANNVVSITPSVTNMVRANYSWVTGYHWGKNMFSKWFY